MWINITINSNLSLIEFNIYLLFISFISVTCDTPCRQKLIRYPDARVLFIVFGYLQCNLCFGDKSNNEVIVLLRLSAIQTQCFLSTNLLKCHRLNDFKVSSINIRLYLIDQRRCFVTRKQKTTHCENIQPKSHFLLKCNFFTLTFERSNFQNTEKKNHVRT